MKLPVLSLNRWKALLGGSYMTLNRLIPILFNIFIDHLYSYFKSKLEGCTFQIDA